MHKEPGFRHTIGKVITGPFGRKVMGLSKIFSVIGEDERQQGAARYLASQGLEVVGPSEVYRADYILLPLPLDPDRVPLAHILEAARPGALALGGKISPQVYALARQAGIGILDYYDREELVLLNVVPTAEGCLEILLREMAVTLWESPVMVLGYGRVGQGMALRLAALGARVTVAARSPAARALARSQGLHSIPLEGMEDTLEKSLAVVNTIPAMVLRERELARLPQDCVVVDLASRPGGVEFGAAARLGVKAIQALSLPARSAPETAGRLVAQTVLTILREKGEVL